ncbi:MAG: threo-3-hydroxy-L-aspartate ammonia-lyase [Candidatus Sumerlaeia bacterium]|nr:threo-3-hydroxy-L-aspartate ammonia-lyase [Candidatus Sumerlaeia bacterium]
MVNSPVGFKDVEDAAETLRGVAHATPVLTSQTLNRELGLTAFLKCENFQRTGAFKFRGAYNALSRLSAEERQRGVLAYSSGNHAQAVALAGRILGIKVRIVMPSDAPAVKLDATRGYGADVVLYDHEKVAREEVGAKLQQEDGSVLIPPFNHPHVIAGQGTAALELFQEVGRLDALFVCVGGGGLISGCGIAAREMSPGCQVVGVEPEAGDDATRSFHSGTLQVAARPKTIADGARTTSLGDLTFPLIMEVVDDMLAVTDQELIDAMEFTWGRMKIITEPTGVLGLAGLFRRHGEFRGKRVGVIISGGNVELSRFARLTLG